MTESRGKNILGHRTKPVLFFKHLTMLLSAIGIYLQSVICSKSLLLRALFNQKNLPALPGSKLEPVE